MKISVHAVAGREREVRSSGAVVIGSGAAALNAAIALHRRDIDVMIVTERWGGGTSANAGSDKQTYYKLALAGAAADSPRQMAEDLAAGGCVHGDIALAEAQHSAQAFYHLVELGVPFPHDAYGGFPGYRTDHDTRGRASSAGPLTSALMVAALGREVTRRAIPVLDRHQVVALLVDGTEGSARQAVGALAIDLAASDRAPAFVLLNTRSIVLATGGPGGMYADSVYPPDQVGCIGMALAVGAKAQNLTESQFGLASVGFRWNVSGSYQQVVPRYVSTGAALDDEHEFLAEVFPDLRTLATAVFRKGYEWPFDPRKVAGFGSSLIDLLVYRERVERGRRVFLDFTQNPGSPGPTAGDASAAQGTPARHGFSPAHHLAPDALAYLRRSGATAATPIERLRQLNQPAVDLFATHGIDLGRDRLEVAVCAQHNNGGLAANHWWESNIEGLFPIGEVNGSHGVYRPGGAALNAGQVGGLRAAMFIGRRRAEPPRSEDAFLALVATQVESAVASADRWLSSATSDLTTGSIRTEIQARMSRAGAIVRSAATARAAAAEAWALRRSVDPRAGARGASEVAELFRSRDMALAHAVYLESIAAYVEHGGRSRGSYVVLDGEGNAGCDALGDGWRFALNDPGAFVDRHVIEIALSTAGEPVTTWAPVRPIPEVDAWFENVWRAYRQDEVIR